MKTLQPRRSSRSILKSRKMRCGNGLKTILKDALVLNDKRIRIAGFTGLPQTSPLPEPFETIRAIWNVLLRRKQ